MKHTTIQMKTHKQHINKNTPKCKNMYTDTMTNKESETHKRITQ